ncbi:MAG: hypothetical protein ACXWMP_14060 [Gemmatimonadaceae bacterium]
MTLPRADYLRDCHVVNKVQNVLDGLITFGGHPSIERLRGSMTKTHESLAFLYDCPKWRCWITRRRYLNP